VQRPRKPRQPIFLEKKSGSYFQSCDGARRPQEVGRREPPGPQRRAKRKQAHDRNAMPGLQHPGRASAASFRRTPGGNGVQEPRWEHARQRDAGACGQVQEPQIRPSQEAPPQLPKILRVEGRPPRIAGPGGPNQGEKETAPIHHKKHSFQEQGRRSHPLECELRTGCKKWMCGEIAMQIDPAKVLTKLRGVGPPKPSVQTAESRRRMPNSGKKICPGASQGVIHSKKKGGEDSRPGKGAPRSDFRRKKIMEWGEHR